MALSNALTKFIPVRLLSGRRLPKLVTTWLKFVPVPVLSAMLACELFVRDGQLKLSFSNLYLWVAVPCFLIAYKTKNMFLTVLCGILFLAGIRSLLPAGY
jgi:branched-subunit amino acid transport protein